MPLGETNNLIALDFDDNIDGLHNKIEELLPGSPLKKKGRKGHTAFYRYNGEQAKKFQIEGSMVMEVLSIDNQTVVPPSVHPDTQQPYIWITPDTLLDIKPEELPALPQNFINDVSNIIKERKRIIKNGKYVDFDTVTIKEPLSYISPDNYDIWYKVGMGLKHIFGDDGLDIWTEWSAKSDKYKPEEIKQKWDSFNENKDKPVTIGTILYYASENGYHIPKKENNTDTKITVTSFSDIEMTPTKWLWDKRIALGKITVMAGQPGLGKSQITAYLASKVSTGNNWVDCENVNARSSVIFLSAEDDPADTIKPRLVASGADVAKCFVIASVADFNKGKKTLRSVDLTTDVENLEKLLIDNDDVRLIVIDPISAYLGNTDSHNNAAIRGLLEPISKLAMQYNVAIIVVTHFNKSTQQEPIERFIGSIGLVAAARAGYGVFKDHDKPEKRYFIPVKNNVGNDHTGFEFSIDEVRLDASITTTKLVFGDAIDAQKVINPPKKSQTNGAKEFLQDLLSDGAKPVKEIFEEAEGMTYSEQTIRTAATKLKVFRKKISFEGGWEWSLTPFPEDKEPANNEDEVIKGSEDITEDDEHDEDDT